MDIALPTWAMILFYMVVSAVSVPVKYVWDDLNETSSFKLSTRHTFGCLYTGAFLGFITATMVDDLWALSNLGLCAIMGLSAGPVMSVLVGRGAAIAERLLTFGKPSLSVGTSSGRLRDTNESLDTATKDIAMHYNALSAERSTTNVKDRTNDQWVDGQVPPKGSGSQGQ